MKSRINNVNLTLLTLFTSFGLSFSQPAFKWPETSVSNIFQEFISAYNSGKEESLEKFVSNNYRRTEKDYVNSKVDFWMDLYYRYGKISPFYISINEPSDLEIWVQGNISKAWFAPELILDESTGKIRAVGILQGELPPNLDIHSKDEKIMLTLFEEYLETNEKNKLFQGTVLLKKGENTLLNKAYGYKNIDSKIRNNEDTRMRISSITKTFTAVACLQLAQKGFIDLHMPISTYLEGLPQHISNKLTVAKLLSHTSGYELDNIQGFREELEKTGSIQEVYQLQQKYLPKWEFYENFDPKNNYNYSNDSYDLLAILIEEIAEMKYEDYIKKYIFDIAGMTMTSFDPEDVASNYRYDLSVRGLKDFTSYYPYTMGKISGAGSLISTTNDLNLFFTTLLNTNRLLDLPHIALLLGPKTNISPASNVGEIVPRELSNANVNSKIYNSYGYGMVISYDEALNIGHGGANIGNSAELRYFPDFNYLLIVLCNNRSGASNAYNFFKSILPLE